MVCYGLLSVPQVQNSEKEKGLGATKGWWVRGDMLLSLHATLFARLNGSDARIKLTASLGLTAASGAALQSQQVAR